MYLRALLCLGALCCSTIVSGQEVPGPDGNQGNLARLILRVDVQQELKLTDQQTKDARAASLRVLEKHREDFDKAWALGEGQPRRVRVGEVFLMVTNETFEELEPVLNPEQINRLKQIELQFFGARAMARPNVIETLNLTEQQQQEYQTLAVTYGRKLSEVSRDTTLSAADKEQKRLEIRSEVADKIRESMDESQRHKWDEMLGSKFDPHIEVNSNT